MTTQTPKAKRKLTNFDFSEEGSHLALVHKDQGGAANSYSTLVTKATGKYSKEFLIKAAEVKVTLSFEEFLRKFFDMWYEDAKILATMLGMQEDEEKEDDWYQNYVSDQVEKFEILKAAHEAENKIEFCANLEEEDYLSVLKNQEMVEKAFKESQQSGGQKPKVESKKKTPASVNKKATTAVHNKENNMSGDNPAMIEKAQYDAIQKALDEQKEQLEKATKALADFEAKEKEAVAKARKADILAAVDVEETAEKVFKAIGDLAPEAFADVVEVLKSLNTKVETSAFFVEKGTKAEGEKVAKSALRTAIENKHNKQ